MSELVPLPREDAAAAWKALVARALDRQHAGDLHTARQLYHQATKSCTDPLPARLLGLLLAEQGDMAAAAHWVRRALQLDPHSAHSHAALGRVLARGGEWPAAAGAFRAAAAGAPEMALAHQGLGQALLVIGDVRAACDSFARALRLRPDDVLTRRSYLAALALQDGLAPTAAAAGAFPAFGELRHAFGQALAGAGRWPEAAAELAAAASLLPADVDVRHNWATALHEAGRPGAALPIYLEALARDSARPRTWHNLGSARQALGDLPGAMAAYGEACRLDPACFARVAQELAAGRHGQVWLRAVDLRRALESAIGEVRAGP